jgi:hypothetical protein
MSGTHFVISYRTPTYFAFHCKPVLSCRIGGLVRCYMDSIPTVEAYYQLGKLHRVGLFASRAKESRVLVTLSISLESPKDDVNVTV